jgi:hypothetical protein
MNEIKRISIQLAAPSGAPGDHGSIAEGHYIVEDGWVMLCDAGGQIIGTGRRLQAGESEQLVAAQLLRAHRTGLHGESGFNRPLSAWPKISVA